jgi:hypothetical protein
MNTGEPFSRADTRPGRRSNSPYAGSRVAAHGLLALRFWPWCPLGMGALPDALAVFIPHEGEVLRWREIEQQPLFRDKNSRI